MMRFLVTGMAILLSCSAAMAQTPLGNPALGPASPLGIPGASAQAGSSGIGFGATEINIGGLSAAVSPACAAVSSVRAMTTTSSFDGGGMAMPTNGCASAAAGSSSVGSAALLPGLATSLSNSSIPLGATELGNAGVSPLIGVGPMTGVGACTSLGPAGAASMSSC